MSIAYCINQILTMETVTGKNSVVTSQITDRTRFYHVKIFDHPVSYFYQEFQIVHPQFSGIG